jgi:dipeptidyl-peptidase-4
MELSTPSFPAQLVRTRLFTLGVPQQFTITAGGSAVLFLRSRAGDDPVTCLWALDLSSATERLLADPAGLTGSSAGAGPASDGAGPASDGAGPASDSGATPGGGATIADGASIGGYATDAAAGLVAFTLDGQLWTIAGPDLGDVRRLPAEGPVTDPRPDPGGRRIAYVSDGSVRVIEAGGTGDRLLMAPDGPDVTAGIGERTGVAGPGGMRGYWWAPDGDRLLVARVDSSGVGL